MSSRRSSVVAIPRQQNDNERPDQWPQSTKQRVALAERRISLQAPAIASITSSLPSNTTDTTFREVVKRRDRSGSHRRGQNGLPITEAESSVAQMSRYPVSEPGEQSRVRHSSRGNQNAIEVANHNAPTNTRIHHPGSRQPASSALTTQQLGHVIRRCNILCGVRMDTAATGLEGPNVSGVALLNLTEEMVHKTPCVETKTTVKETTSERNMSYMKAGWEQESLTVRPPFILPPVGSTSQQSSSQETESSRYFKASHTFARLRITIDTSLAAQSLNPKFKTELNNALLQREERRQNLERLFEKWGHVVATEVVLGGEHRLLTEAVNVTKHTAEQIQNQLKKHLKVPRRPAEGQETSGSSVIQQEAYFSALSRVSSTYVGGDPRYHSDAQFDQWAQSIENSKYWDVIRREKVIPIIDLLPPEQKQQILMAIPKPLVGRWLTETQLNVIRCNNLQVYQPRLTAEDVQNGWRSLGQSLDPSKVLIVKESPFDPNALSKIDSVKISWRSRHLFHSDIFCHLTPSTTEYTALGSIFLRGPFLGKPEAQYEASSYTCSIRADLLAPARCADEPCRGGKGKGSLWPIVPVKRDGAETTINLGMFQVGAGSQSPGTVLGLKPDSIEILNP